MELSSRANPDQPPPAASEATSSWPARVLFLDDDPSRALRFLEDCPHAVWVQTAADCIARLEESWDEVHLDHDLGGEQFVDTDREDCGMEVVRWICLTPRGHLRSTRFLIHSHNSVAATIMGMQMTVSGFNCDVRPFGMEREETVDKPEEESLSSLAPRPTGWERLRSWIRGKLGIHDPIDPAFYDYLAGHPDPDAPPPERPDFFWTPSHPDGAPEKPAE